ncbi:MAG: D-alanine--D-alanine ligase [Oscillospiraceae bacterium]|jgi:D-alanine-D-alanine ligase|nr:D-alanine--D-alanine ligase [Oscillospiraceae bacterium]
MKIQVAVIFGGRSVEHEVSVISAMQVMAALDVGKHDVIPVYIAKDGAMYTGENLTDIKAFGDIPRLLEDARQVAFMRAGGKVVLQPAHKRLFGSEKPIYIDMALPAVHGTFAEDGSLQGYLELLGLPYCGCDVLSSAICMNKPAAKNLMKSAGIPVLPHIVMDKDGELDFSAAESAFGYPVIVKPDNLGSSVGITKAKDRPSFEAAAELAFCYSSRAVVEPAVTDLREINVSVLGDKDNAEASVCEEPLGRDEILSFKDKYLRGDKSGKGLGMTAQKRVIPADLAPEKAERARELALAAFRALGCHGVARVDLLLSGGRDFYVNEVNTIPGSLSYYLWEKSGLPFPALLDKLIALAFARSRSRSELSYTFDVNLLQGATATGKP